LAVGPRLRQRGWGCVPSLVLPERVLFFARSDPANAALRSLFDRRGFFERVKVYL
jgi:hypothetical protein